MEAPWIRKDMVQHQPRHPVCGTLLDDFAAHIFHHVPEMHSTRTCRLARAAIQATEHVLHEGVGDGGAAFVIGAHEIDAAAGRVHLVAEHTVGRARGQAQSAVNAIQVKSAL